MKIAIIEDNPLDSDALMALLQKYASQNNDRAEIHEFPSGEDFLVDGPSDFDLIFLDIQMREQNGIEIARIIRKSNQRVVIVFVTNNPEYSLDGYSVEAMDYLIKPVRMEILDRVLKKVLQKLEVTDRMCLTIHSHDGFFVVNYGDICFIEFANRKLLVETKTGPITCMGTMQAMEEMLPGNFFRVHSGFLINLRAVERLKGQDVIVAGRQIPISKHRRKEFVHALTKQFGDIL
jgi:DNA-binding LytR/AlgR family response regulator